MNTMKQTIKTTALAIAAITLAACGAEKSEPAAATVETIDSMSAAIPSADTQLNSGTAGKPGAPYRLEYKIIGTPVVGSPLTIDLNVMSTLGPQPVTIEYKMTDTAAMMLAEAQPSRVDLRPAVNEVDMRQQVTIVPLREGRLFLNVAASFDSGDGTMSTVMAIPVQVGAGGRELEENGALSSDENGEAIRVIDGG